MRSCVCDVQLQWLQWVDRGGLSTACSRILDAAGNGLKPAISWRSSGVTRHTQWPTSIVSFTPGARTAWHNHPVGQTLFGLSGAGRVQRDGEQVQEIRAGDTVIIPPNVRHLHGSAPGKLFSHLAMSELNDKGEGTAWFEHVSDADYNAAPAPVT